MEPVKKLLPFLLVAIVFAVGGYFIGKGSLDNQGASLYSANKSNPGAISKTETIITPAGLMLVTGHDEDWCVRNNGYWIGQYDVVDQDGNRHKGDDGCEFIVNKGPGFKPVPTTTVKNPSTTAR